MGFIDMLGGAEPRGPNDYVALDTDGLAMDARHAETRVHIADISEQRDVIEIKDALYDGDMVIADITTLRTSGPMIEHVIDQLEQTVGELGGDIVKKGDDQLIITPSSMAISREKLHRE